LHDLVHEVNKTEGKRTRNVKQMRPSAIRHVKFVRLGPDCCSRY